MTMSLSKGEMGHVYVSLCRRWTLHISIEARRGMCDVSTCPGRSPFLSRNYLCFPLQYFWKNRKKSLFWLSMPTEPAWNDATVVLGCHCWPNSTLLMKVMQEFRCSCDLRGPESRCGQKHGRQAHRGNSSPSDGVQKDVEEAEVRPFAKAP